MNRNTLAPQIPRTTLNVPGFKDLTVTVYGVADAKTTQEAAEQGYFVELDGQPTVRAELLDAEKHAVRDFLRANYPQHAVI